MKDSVIKGTGNSRTLKSVPNFMSIYPTYEAFAEAMVAGTLPVDLSALQAVGTQTFGTDYSKATCLPQPTESAIWGDIGDRTIGEALLKLRNLITTAQSKADTADNRFRCTYGTYIGSGPSSGLTTKTISLGFKGRLLIVGTSRSSTGVIASPSAFTCFGNPSYSEEMSISFSGNNVTISGQRGGNSGFNISNTTYAYFALGEA